MIPIVNGRLLFSAGHDTDQSISCGSLLANLLRSGKHAGKTRNGGCLTIVVVSGERDVTCSFYSYLQ